MNYLCLELSKDAKKWSYVLTIFSFDKYEKDSLLMLYRTPEKLKFLS